MEAKYLEVEQNGVDLSFEFYHKDYMSIETYRSPWNNRGLMYTHDVNLDREQAAQLRDKINEWLGDE